jgi:hypothetical protein
MILQIAMNMSYSVAFYCVFIHESYKVNQQIQCLREYSQPLTCFGPKGFTTIIKSSVHRFINVHTVMHVYCQIIYDNNILQFSSVCINVCRFMDVCLFFMIVLTL